MFHVEQRRKMIVLIILFSLAALYFLWSYKEDPKLFKIRLIPVIGICFFAATDYFQLLDERLQLSLLVIAILITLHFAYEYYKDFKLVRFREKKRIREEREELRREQSDKILEEIFELKHGLRKPSREINLSSMIIDYKDVKQLTVFGDAVDFLEFMEEGNLDPGPNAISTVETDKIDSQLEMFHVEHITDTK